MPATTISAPLTADPSALLHTSPLPFAIALVVVALAMFAWPRAAVPLGAVIILGALVYDQRAVEQIHAGQAGKRPSPASTIPAAEELLMFQGGTLK